MTGIPTILKEEFSFFEDKENLNTNRQATSYQTFRDALTCDEVLYKTKKIFNEHRFWATEMSLKLRVFLFQGPSAYSKFKIQ